MAPQSRSRSYNPTLLPILHPGTYAHTEILQSYKNYRDLQSYTFYLDLQSYSFAHTTFPDMSVFFDLQSYKIYHHTSPYMSYCWIHRFWVDPTILQNLPPHIPPHVAWIRTCGLNNGPYWRGPADPTILQKCPYHIPPDVVSVRTHWVGSKGKKQESEYCPWGGIRLVS